MPTAPQRFEVATTLSVAPSSRCDLDGIRKVDRTILHLHTNEYITPPFGVHWSRPGVRIGGYERDTSMLANGIESSVTWLVDMVEHCPRSLSSNKNRNMPLEY